jgi:hypothetical protein
VRRSKSWDGRLQDANSMGDSLPQVGKHLRKKHALRLAVAAGGSPCCMVAYSLYRDLPPNTLISATLPPNPAPVPAPCAAAPRRRAAAAHDPAGDGAAAAGAAQQRACPGCGFGRRLHDRDCALLGSLPGAQQQPAWGAGRRGGSPACLPPASGRLPATVLPPPLLLPLLRGCWCPAGSQSPTSPSPPFLCLCHAPPPQGTGGFGSVYEATWRGRRVAVKTLPQFGPDQPCSESMYGALLREIELASKFSSDRCESSHPCSRFPHWQPVRIAVRCASPPFALPFCYTPRQKTQSQAFHPFISPWASSRAHASLSRQCPPASLTLTPTT